MTAESLEAKPFHIYDDEFHDVIGESPTLTLIAESDKNPLFHEAVVWYVHGIYLKTDAAYVTRILI